MKSFVFFLFSFLISTVTIAQPYSSEMDDIVNTWLDENLNPSVVACTVKGNEIIWMDAYGMANTNPQMEATVDTPYMLASVSKTITATAILQLWGDDQISLEDDVDDYLDFEVNHPDHAAAITIEQLLTHSSAIKDNWNVMPYCDGDCTVSLSDFLESYFTPGMPNYNASSNFYGYEPGAQYNYSNIGAALIGLLVEEITGTPFDQYCEENIFAPTCMNNTHWFLSQFPDVSQIAIPHDTWVNPPVAVDHYGYPDYPDGQLRSSIRDMANWLLMNINGGSFNGANVQSLSVILETFNVQFGSDQGYIWYNYNLDGDIVWGHNGGDLGVSSDIIINPENGIGIAVISNGDDWVGELLEPIYQWAKIQGSTGDGWPDCVTSVYESVITESWSVHPNPASEFIEINGNIGDEYQIRDCTGRIILEGGLTGDTEVLDLNGFNSGVYFLVDPVGNRNSKRVVIAEY